MSPVSDSGSRKPCSSRSLAQSKESTHVEIIGIGIVAQANVGTAVSEHFQDRRKVLVGVLSRQDIGWKKRGASRWGAFPSEVKQRKLPRVRHWGSYFRKGAIFRTVSSDKASCPCRTRTATYARSQHHLRQSGVYWAALRSSGAGRSVRRLRSCESPDRRSQAA